MSEDSEDFYFENGLMVFTEKYHLKRGHCCHSDCRHCPFKKIGPTSGVISLVPSWTETLIHAGVKIVGRTRFCIHPKEKVKAIPIIGGTKNWNWEKIVEINPDLIVLDREENPKTMSEQESFLWTSTHVQSIADMPEELSKLSQLLSNAELEKFSKRWRSVLSAEAKAAVTDFSQLPGVIHWGSKPNQKIKTVLYVIWKDPWMAVSRDTFIGSMLSRLGVELPPFSEKYPKINPDDFDPDETLLLFSTEPYPFQKMQDDLKVMGFPYAIIDGESFSWFGIRSLEFLEKNI